MTSSMKTRIAALGIPLIFGVVLTACKTNSSETTVTGNHATAHAARYRCAMHPQIVSDKPGKCPICHMDLVPFDDAPTINHHAAVQMSQTREQLIGVRTALAEKRRLIKKIQASAKVAYDAELYGAIIEYREAVKAHESIHESPWADVKERSESLVASSKLKLQVMGLSDRQIAQLTQSSKDPTELLLAEPGKNVWIYAQIYEQEAGIVKSGQKITVTSSALMGRSYAGHIISVDRVLNPETRSLRVRAEVPNPEGRLLPEMYVDASIEADLGEALAVPTEAVMNTGSRQLVFVQTGEGRYEPRDVITGREASDHVEIVSGISDGERVAISANFLLDSESKLKSALSEGAHSH